MAERDLQAAFTELHRQDALEWRLVSTRSDSQDIAGDVARSRQQFVALVERATSSASVPDTEGRRLTALQAAYAAAVDRELALYADGRDEQAQALDQQVVDPAFDALVDAMTSQGELLAATGRNARTLSDAGLVLGVVLGVLLVGLVRGRQRRLDVRQEAERRGERRYRVLIDQSSDLVVVTDRAGRMVYRSPAAERALEGERPTDSLLDALETDDRGLIERAVAEVGPARPVTLQSRLSSATGPRVIDWTLRDLTGEPDIAGIVWTGHDVSERHTLQSQLEHRALHDALTGLPNRALLADRVQQALRAGPGADAATGLLLIDLDRFKEVNDTLGHHVGDELLVAVGRRLRSAVRAGDTVARLGGDEFAVVLPLIEGVTYAVEMAKSLQEALSASFSVSGAELTVDASVGVVLSGRDGDDPSVLLQRADVAMYSAKQSGVPVAVYDPDLDLNNPERLNLLADLKRALSDDDQLFLVYQPKIDLRTGEVCGAEALLRWHHPTRGIVAPDSFIPLAENTGLIGRVTAAVLRLALAQAAHWLDEGRPLQIAVNLSARNLLDDHLVPLIEELLQAHEIPVGLLKLEVTETAIMADPGRAKATLDRLDGLGIALSIDDFGAGYTSLAQLTHLPIGELKVDRTFVQAMTTDITASTIVRSVVELGHNLGLTTVAEGVETDHALQALIANGCDIAQGYYLARPLPSDAFDAWRRDWCGLGPVLPARSEGGTLVPHPRTPPASDDPIAGSALVDQRSSSNASEERPTAQSQVIT